MDTAMFHTPILTILSLIIHSSKNKAVEVSSFAIIFNGIYLTQTANDFQI